MFEKNMKYAYLTDIYGGLLEKHAREWMDAYYNEDLSLAEIAEGTGISRQGIRQNIKKCEEMLDLYEEKLGLLKKSTEAAAMADELSRIGDAAPLSEADRKAICALAARLKSLM